MLAKERGSLGQVALSLVDTMRKEYQMFEESEKRSRPVQMKFFVTKSEKRRIKERMSGHQLNNFSTFARTMLLEGEVKVINFEELREFRREVRRVGVNVNQIAKQVNMDDEVDLEQLGQVLTSLKELNHTMNVLLKTIEKNAERDN